MPSLSVGKDELLRMIEKPLHESALEEHVFNFGIELDEIYEEEGKTMYKFDIPANRYDLLCIEGLANALKSYINSDRFVDVTIHPPTMTVTKHATHERQHIACAVIRDIAFTKESYDSFISYQDKLHSSIGRNRSIVAIGTHDMDRIKGDITYESINLEEVSFVPLSSEKRAGRNIKGSDLKEYFDANKKISKYFSLWSDQSKSVAFRCGGRIMSIPPIINSDETKISLNTRDVFVEVTGTDFNRVNTALKQILYNFRGRRIESVHISSPDGSVLTTPVFHDREYSLSVESVNSKLHLTLPSAEIEVYLLRMMYSTECNGPTILVKVPDLRSDVMHECDIIEDIAVAYGFNNFTKSLPNMVTIGSEDPLNKFTDKLRIEFALCGFNEVLTLTLLSSIENFVDSEKAVVLSNPKSKEYEVVRTALLPGVLKSVASNLHGRIPIRMFEVSDVVHLCSDEPENAKNLRHACGVISANTSLLEELQGPLSFVLEKCGVTDYCYKHSTLGHFLENQCADVVVGGVVIGSIGVLHPNICQNFKIPYASSAFEIDIEYIYSKYIKRTN